MPLDINIFKAFSDRVHASMEDAREDAKDKGDEFKEPDSPQGNAGPTLLTDNKARSTYT
jgi:hypothetical protein